MVGKKQKTGGKKESEKGEEEMKREAPGAWRSQTILQKVQQSFDEKLRDRG